MQQLVVRFSLRLRRLRRDAEQLPAKRESVLFRAVGQKAEMADADEGGWKGVKKEPPDEFFRGQSHNIALVAVATIAKSKGDVAVLDVENAVVGNGDAVGIAAEVVEDFIRPAERRLGINDPALLAKLSDQIGESGSGLKLSGLPREDQLAAGIGLKEEAGILAAKDLGESSDGEKKVFGGIDPALVVFRQGAGGDETMEMEMSVESLIPGMQDGDKAGFAAEIVIAEGQKSLGGGIEQDF